MEALQNLTGKQSKTIASSHNENHNEKVDGWQEAEQQNESMYNTQGLETLRQQANDGSSYGVNNSCFRFFMANGDNNLWEKYGLKLNN
ncbi:hypothetical protein V6N11_003203 [Hibiscus sabdariffa]|uniref:Uncharacterized protein n=1 Tax=Hibiscus sabdariffa TaxID=183260 RepID=A0ABR2SCQ2_9ROSI